LDTTLSSNNITVTGRRFPMSFQMSITLNYNVTGVLDATASQMVIQYVSSFTVGGTSMSERHNVPTDVSYVIRQYSNIFAQVTTSYFTPNFTLENSNPGGTCNCAITIFFKE
jgi:hypothetical protein